MSDSKDAVLADISDRRKLTVPHVVVLIIAASAPLTVVAGGATTAFSVTGSIAVPIAYIVLAISLAIFAVGYVTMSRFVRNAGAFYAYISRGLGKPYGVGGAFVALVSYNFMQIGIYGMFGFQVAVFLNDTFGWDIEWWMPILVAIVVVGFLGVNRVDLSAKVLGIIVVLEFVAVIVFDAVAFMNAPEGVSAAPIMPSALFSPGIGAVLVFGIAAFMGFESAAIYSEEAKDPKKTVSQATFIAVLIIGVFYAISSLALANGIGPDKIASGGITLDEAGPPLFFNIVGQYLGTVAVDIMSLMFITSLFAALVAFHNAVARYLFALGREGVLPRGLGAVRPQTNAPWAGSLAQTVTATIVVGLFGIAGMSSEYGVLFPVITLFSWLTNAGAMGLVMLMTVVSVAVIGFFRREHHGVSPWARLIAPGLSFFALGLIFLLILINFNVLLDQPNVNVVTFVLPAMVLLPGVLGFWWARYLRDNNPGVYEEIGFGGNGEATPGPSESGITLGEDVVHSK